LDTWDKLDVPYIQDGYLLSIGFATLQELCKSVQNLVEQNFSLFQQQQQAQADPTKARTLISLGQHPVISYRRLVEITPDLIANHSHLSECMATLSACSHSFLFVYNILLESSLDETITEQIVKTMKTLIYLSSLLNLTTQRDAFVTALCKAALPANYAHNVLNLKLITDLSNTQLNSSTDQSVPPFRHDTTPKTYSYDDSTDRQIQLVAVGPALHLSGVANSASSPLSSASQSSTPHTLNITAKNLLIMKSILNMSHIYSELIGSSWYIILNTMQHLTWTLGLKPSQGSIGQLKHTISSSAVNTSSSNAVVSTASSSQIQPLIPDTSTTNNGRYTKFIKINKC